MKGKVTLKELVGTKIIYALLLVGYYWTGQDGTGMITMM